MQLIMILNVTNKHWIMNSSNAYYRLMHYVVKTIVVASIAKCYKHFMIRCMVNACLLADNCIPSKSNKKSSKKCIPGWNEHVIPLKEQAIFWHNMWQDNGRPRYGHIADIRRSTRAQYHNIITKA